MKSKKLIIVAALSGALTTGAYASDISPYIGGRVGFQTLTQDGSDTANTGLSYAGAIGARWKGEIMNLRGEIEYSLASFSNEDESYPGPSTTLKTEFKFNPTTYMANFYADFLTNYKIRPYLGAGLGMVDWDWSLKTDLHYNSGVVVPISDYNYSKNGFIYGLYGGIGFNMVAGLDGDIGMRYTATTIENVGFWLLSLNFGLRYTF